LVDLAGEPVTPGYQDFYNDRDFKSDDSLEDVNNTAHPSAAFLMASQRPAAVRDDSFDSNESDSDDDDGPEKGLAPVHPWSFAQGSGGYDEEDGFDDSFDDAWFGSASNETDTLFGVQPERISMME